MLLTLTHEKKKTIIHHGNFVKYHDIHFRSYHPALVLIVVCLNGKGADVISTIWGSDRSHGFMKRFLSSTWSLSSAEGAEGRCSYDGHAGTAETLNGKRKIRKEKQDKF